MRSKQGITRSQKARKAYKEANGGESKSELSHDKSGDYAHYNKPLPKSHTDFRRVLAYVNSYIETQCKEKGEMVPTGISTVNVKVFERMYNIALRDNTKKETLVCPKCDHAQEIEMLDSVAEKTSSQMLAKLSDKLAPNLAAITQDININFLIINIRQHFLELITKYVEPKDRETEANKLIQVLTQIENSET